jgi:hypothetical protein
VKRIFYFSGYRLTVFHWQHNQCIDSYAFNPGEDGIAKFQTYLKATENTPVRILIDLIEEDFVKESIPHVGPGDRKAIVQRMVERQYRKSRDFFQYRVLEREKSGRRDDVILYSVLSNPDILHTWLAPMQQAGTAIAGIWSLPLLSPKLYPSLSTQANNVLLVSQQVPSNLRQTFIRNGRFENSRSAVVNLEDAPLGEYISIEVEQTIRFLSNQRHIGFDEKIEVHVICRQQDIEPTRKICSNSALRTFYFHDLDEIEKTLHCDTGSTEYSNGLYSYLCAKQPVPVGHYGNAALFSHYYQQLTSKALYAASVLILLVATLFAFAFISDSIVLDEEALTLQQQTRGINNNYQRQFAHLQDQLNQAEMMRSAVLLSDNIREATTISPMAFMNQISHISGNADLNNISLTKLEWSTTQQDKLSGEPLTTLTDYSNIENINHFARLSGFVRMSQSSYKQSIQQLNQLAESFRKQAEVLAVKINSYPIDTRSETELSLQVEQQDNRINDENDGKFVIDILLRGQPL